MNGADAVRRFGGFGCFSTQTQVTGEVGRRLYLLDVAVTPARLPHIFFEAPLWAALIMRAFDRFLGVPDSVGDAALEPCMKAACWREDLRRAVEVVAELAAPGYLSDHARCIRADSAVFAFLAPVWFGLEGAAVDDLVRTYGEAAPT